jgi:hypothetical protein
LEIIQQLFRIIASLFVHGATALVHEGLLPSNTMEMFRGNDFTICVLPSMVNTNKFVRPPLSMRKLAISLFPVCPAPQAPFRSRRSPNHTLRKAKRAAAEATLLFCQNCHAPRSQTLLQFLSGVVDFDLFA